MNTYTGLASRRNLSDVRGNLGGSRSTFYVQSNALNYDVCYAIKNRRIYYRVLSSEDFLARIIDDPIKSVLIRLYQIYRS